MKYMRVCHCNGSGSLQNHCAFLKESIISNGYQFSNFWALGDNLLQNTLIADFSSNKKFLDR